MNISAVKLPLALVTVLAASSACTQNSGSSAATDASVAAAESSHAIAGDPSNSAAKFGATATIQELMKYMVDPSADELWESVSTVFTGQGVDELHPRTAEEWDKVRHAALTLIEAANLLAMPGRKVVAPGGTLEDAHHADNLTADQVQALLDETHPRFEGFAGSLNAAGKIALAAIDAKDPEKLLEAGEAIDAACEACHITYWYPQEVPLHLKVQK